MESARTEMPILEAVKRVVVSPYWEPEEKELLREDFVLDFLNAPPGMPQHMEGFGLFIFKSWMCRTVKRWEVELEQLHETPGKDLFWAIGKVRAQVYWGGRDGVLDTPFIMKIEMKDGKVRRISQMMDPLKFLEAAGREVPVFRMDLYHERVEQALKEAREPEDAGAEELDMSPEAIEKRRYNNLYSFTAGDYLEEMPKLQTVAPDAGNRVIFLPPEMEPYYPPEMIPRVEMWTHLSCPSLTFYHEGAWYPTEDPNLFFAEYACYGDTEWLGNGVSGHYQNSYFYLIRLDDAGRMAYWEEYLNSINKFNSINVSIPSFPYYF